MADLKTEQVITQIETASGNVSVAAKNLRVSRTTLYKFINDHSTVKAALDEAREKMIDNVESSLYNQALSGNTAAMIFFLKTQGKSRGYVERSELSGPNGGPLSWKQFIEGGDGE
jgi:hypothetical protein